MAAIHCVLRTRILPPVSKIRHFGSLAITYPNTRIIVFNGFEVFTHETWDEDVITNFFTAYIQIPIFFGLYAFWKIFKRPKFVKPAEADITTGKAALDAEVWPAIIPRNALERFWYWLV
jgi:amino acid transporter